MSKQQLNNLGKRIATTDPPDQEDLVRLNQVLGAYQGILGQVDQQLSLMGLAVTLRVKTRGVLIEKLRREHGMSLARVQDLAGARTIVEGGRIEQDALVARLISHFDAWTGKPSKVIDRRLKPSHGYRAVHVIVFPDGVPVEIQLRTELQNVWAQVVERLADRWSRGVRYGAPPDEAGRFAEGVVGRDGSPLTRQQLIEDLRSLSDEIGDLEEAEHDLLAPLDPEDADAEDADLPRVYSQLRSRFKRVVAEALLANDSSRLIRRKVGRIIRRTVPAVRNPDPDLVLRAAEVCNEIADDLSSRILAQVARRQAMIRGTLQELVTHVDRGGVR